MIFSIHNRTGHKRKITWATFTFLFIISGGFLILPPWVGFYSLFQISSVSSGFVEDEPIILQSDLAGMIAIWNGSIASIPEGWVLCDGNLFTPNLTDRFVQSTDFRESPGKTGGVLSHKHTYTQVPQHNHAVNDPGHTHWYSTKSFNVGFHASVSNPDLSKAFFYDNADSDVSSISKIYAYLNSTGNDGSHFTDNSTTLPPYVRMPFIMKKTDTPLLPAGIIVFWAYNISTIPQGWLICNGSAGNPDLINRFILGTDNESQIGSIGGEATHIHAYDSLPQHTHSVFDPGHQHTIQIPTIQKNKVTTAGGSYSTFLYYFSQDTTGYPYPSTGISIADRGSDSCFTDPVDNLPPYINLVPIVKETNSNILPIGSISMWNNDFAVPPLHTSFCDGSNDTPNLYGRFIRTVDLDGEINLTGGSFFHSHRYLSVPKHTHNISITTHIHNFKKQSEIFNNVLLSSTGEWISRKEYTSIETGKAYTGIQVSFTGDEYCTTDIMSILPPYYRLGFFMAGSNLSQIPWEEPDDECPTCNNTNNGCIICLDPLSPELFYAAAGIGSIFFLSMAIIVRKRRK